MYLPPVMLLSIFTTQKKKEGKKGNGKPFQLKWISLFVISQLPQDG